MVYHYTGGKGGVLTPAGRQWLQQLLASKRQQ
jgi:Spy/CpxP family protein refolding chaperone